MDNIDYDIYIYDRDNRKKLLYTANDIETADELVGVLRELAETGYLTFPNGEKVDFVGVEHFER